MIDQKIIVSYLEGELHPSEAERLVSWLISQPGAPEEFKAVKEQWLKNHNVKPETARAWQKLQERIGAESNITAEQRVTAARRKGAEQRVLQGDEGNKRNRSIRQIVVKSLSYAAMVAVLVISTWFIVTKVEDKGSYADNACLFTTAKGEKCQVLLPDSTLVRLNSGTVLKFYPQSFNKRGRVVELEGEAYFVVKSDPHNPFTVVTSDFNVVATGTAFNVMAYEQIARSEVLLVEGSVTVESRDQEIVLNQGERAVYINSHLQKGIVNQSTTLGWRDDMFLFSQITFSELMFRLENWFNVDIEYDKTAFNYSYSGSFKNRESVEQILDAIRKYDDISYHRIDNTIIITRPDQSNNTKNMDDS